MIDSVDKIEKVVKGFVGIVPAEDIQHILVELGTIRGYFQRAHEIKAKPNRVHFPKVFSIEQNSDYIKLQEVTPSDTIFCSDTQYDVIVDAVFDMQSRRENFDRWTLQTEANKIDPRITVPAILTCLHLWFSIPAPLLVKEEKILKLRCNVHDFKNQAAEVWNSLIGNDLRIVAPKRLFIKR